MYDYDSTNPLNTGYTPVEYSSLAKTHSKASLMSILSECCVLGILALWEENGKGQALEVPCTNLQHRTWSIRLLSEAGYKPIQMVAVNISSRFKGNGWPVIKNGTPRDRI